jgi:hypothetical protein
LPTFPNQRQIAVQALAGNPETDYYGSNDRPGSLALVAHTKRKECPRESMEIAEKPRYQTSGC